MHNDVAGIEQHPVAMRLALGPGADATACLALVAQAVPCSRVELRRATLEDVFVAIVTGEDRS